MICLVCSVPAEADLLLDRIQPNETVTLGTKTLVEGRISGLSIALGIGSMGKVNAAHTAALMILRYQPAAIIVYGIGGAYPLSGLRIGDIALASEEIAGDEGVLTREGFKDTEYIGIPLHTTASATIFNTFPASRTLLEKAADALRSRSDAKPMRVGPFITLSTCTGTVERAQELERRYHGLCENMEGAAVAQVALSHGIPWLELRGISNIVEDRDLTAWDIPCAARSVQEAVLTILASFQE